MQWLIANMWMALAAATFLGLLFGFSFRGLLVGSRIRKANVEREIAKTELSQSKAEVEALYAAQRKRKEEAAQSVGVDNGLQTELEEREARISSLGDELDAARAELEQLKSEASAGGDSNLVETAGAAVAGAAVGALLSDEDQEELTQLRDRNTWLEERVVALEVDLSAAADSTPDPEPAPAAPTENDEELARLRWRNRYLEGRLAYFEETEEAAAAEDAVQEEAVDEVSEEAPEAVIEEDTGPEDAPDEVSDEAPEEAQGEPEPEAEPEAGLEPVPVAAAAADGDDMHPSEAMLAELEGVQPDQIEQPASGGDDLTNISGIGPRIAEVLNEQGIWSYAQIAAWTPENATWIENHLSFKGRVERENWIEQAKELMA